MRGKAIKLLTVLMGRKPTKQDKARFKGMTHVQKGALRARVKKAQEHRELTMSKYYPHVYGK
jgi:hypothetical protein